MNKVYLGDAVYAEHDKHGDIVLTTEDGYRATNRIVMEPEVLQAFLLCLERFKKESETGSYCVYRP